MPRPPEGATGVSAGSTTSETSEREINGPRVLIITAITDIGYVINRFDKGESPPPIRSCFVEGVFSDGQEPVKISRDIKLSFDERSNLVAFITATRGGKPPADDEQVDPGEIVGIPIQITIESKPQKDSSNFWLSMKTPTALMEGVTVPDSLAMLVTDESVPFVWKTDEELAASRVTLGALSPAQGGGDSGGYGSGGYDPQDDRPEHDDLPF